MEKGFHKNFLKVTARGSMEVIGKIAVYNSMSFEGFKIRSTPDDYVPSEVNNIKGEPVFESIDNPGQWSQYCYRKNFKKSRQELCSPYVTKWFQIGTCEPRGETEMWCLGISLCRMG